MIAPTVRELASEATQKAIRPILEDVLGPSLDALAALRDAADELEDDAARCPDRPGSTGPRKRRTHRRSREAVSQEA